MARDLGAPIAYLALPEGVPVLTSDGEQLGEVRHVLADREADIFDGLVVRASGRDVFVDAPLVDALHERGAVLTVDAAAARELPEPRPNPPAMGATPDDTVPDSLEDRLEDRLRR